MNKCCVVDNIESVSGRQSESEVKTVKLMCPVDNKYLGLLEMDSIKVATTTSAPSLASTKQLFKNAPREAKTRPLVPLVLPTSSYEVNSVSSNSSSPSTASSSSTDKTDNHDTFGFYPEVPDMKREDERLKTFDKWPVSFLSPEMLAKNGFYYLGRGDEVRCAFCKVEIMRWVEGDDPAKDHQRWAPQCSFLRRHAGNGNVPLDAPATTGRDECGTRVPLAMPGPVHPKYASQTARLNSFKDWPRMMRQKPEELAEAGFFYTGQGDKTKCFYCDGGLKDWEEDDVPWEQHARWFDRCAYVQKVKGRDYVQKVMTEACAVNSSKEERSAETVAPSSAVHNANTGGEEENPVDDSKLCKICYAEERNVCFVPCGHVFACAKCALSTDKCPVCRRTLQDVLRLYFL